MEHAHARSQLFVGVDVAATTISVAWQGVNQAMSAPRTFAQSADGITTLMGQLQRTGVDPAHTFVVMEATGSYWITLATTLHHAGYVISVVNATHAHHFAKSHGQRAKTDAVDTRMLVRLAQERHPPAWSPPPTVYHELRQRLMARDGLLAMRTQARNQRHALQQWPKDAAGACERSDVLDAAAWRAARLSRAQNNFVVLGRPRQATSYWLSIDRCHF